MRILWITNILLPGACAELGVQAPVVGGWMQASALSLSNQEDIQLAVATVYAGTELKTVTHDRITYYLLPSQKNSTKYDKHLEPYWQQIKESFNPDVVHIHGTEFATGLSYIKSVGNSNVVISIQGLVSVIKYYQWGGLSIWDRIRNYTLGDFIRFLRDGNRYSFSQRGEIEKEYLRSVQHIIGRTLWDKAHAWAINPNANYYVCNELLRPAFYESKKWDYSSCKKYSIFISQGSQPLKGFHQLIKALPLILREFPDTHVYVAGEDYVHTNKIVQRIRLTTYEHYVRKLINRNDVKKNITFLGTLNENEMVQQYLSANIFVSTSCIENSSNALCEAQYLGVPYVASYVGGTSSLAPNFETKYLYRFEEWSMLGFMICELFKRKKMESNRDSYDILERHDINTNVNKQLLIYDRIAHQK